MSSANRDTAPLRHPDRFFIGGEWVLPTSRKRIDVIQPATEEVYVTVADASADDMDRAIAAARAAFDSGPWPRLTPKERAGYLRDIGMEITRRAGELSHIWTSEMGIVHAIARETVPGIGAAWTSYADLADDFQFVERLQPQGGQVRLLAREPVGVVGAIIPWNGPLAIIAHKAAPALLAGCTVVLKMSPEAPGAGYMMAEIAESVGLPPGVLNVITADREVSEQLVSDARVDKIAFTGSTATGRRIASICAERIARYTLELGGKSAALILDDYDLATAADSLSASTRRMTGQVCSALTRVIIDRRRHDDFVDALADSFSKIRVGDPFDDSTDMGPLAMQRQLDRVQQFIAAGVAGGAKLVTGGRRPPELNRGYFIEPTVFADVDHRTQIAQEEIFGPVLSVIPAENLDEAIHIANDTIYGLNASVFTNHEDRAYEVSRALRSGTVGHNAQRADYGIAFGGFKQSGVGREGGREGLLTYLETKAIILNGEPSELI
ncbi:aldehyde dehydrogenase [Mycobacterium branderi]|uniref:Aldehyde dehydrogenase n=1 Tax=Mycobacterium branderi TaxID=43348 RepID=A0A7I7WDE3_9MYCO|nr:aldehyde dehydrogenase [Mycobacterium branderi]MCV7231879.1 aldehyde dehydrogenase [Mycobacterium branderi]ORA40181.1 aldehyde dehydrogenase [Mycobacterium branderi]BBZ15464.1 aldehyde dehydrogenase [Mycobacterium branderi]